MAGIEILEPIKSDILGKDVDTLLASIENGKFILVNGVIGGGQEYLIRNLAEKTNRLAVLVDLEYIQDCKNVNLSDTLSYFVDSIIDRNKELIFLIKRNKLVADYLKEIEDVKKTFEEIVFSKLNAVVFYMILESHKEEGK